MTLRIKEHRLRSDWTLEHLASITGLSRGFLSQIENGRRKASAATLEILAEAFKCKVTDLYTTGQSSDEGVNSLVNSVQNLSPRNRQIVLELIAALQLSQAAPPLSTPGDDPLPTAPENRSPTP